MTGQVNSPVTVNQPTDTGQAERQAFRALRTPMNIQGLMATGECAQPTSHYKGGDMLEHARA